MSLTAQTEIKRDRFCKNQKIYQYYMTTLHYDYDPNPNRYILTTQMVWLGMVWLGMVWYEMQQQSKICPDRTGPSREQVDYPLPYNLSVPLQLIRFLTTVTITTDPHIHTIQTSI